MLVVVVVHGLVHGWVFIYTCVAWDGDDGLGAKWGDKLGF